MPITLDFRHRYVVDSDLTPGFATIHDLRLGDLLIPDSIDQQWYLDAAWSEIEAELSTCYLVPITRDVPEETANILALIHTYAASSQLLMEQAMGRESEMALAQWMRSRADERLDSICQGKTDLNGVERLIDTDAYDEITGDNKDVPAIFTKESSSPFDALGCYARPATHQTFDWRPGSAMTGRGL